VYHKIINMKLMANIKKANTVVLLLYCHGRNLIYTVVTRGKKLVVIVGQSKALAMAVKNRKSNQRLTKLKERIADGN